MPTSLPIDEDLQGRLEQLAARRRHSPDRLLREAIEQYVAREEARDGFHAEAEASWQAYRETGAHLTAEETRDWLETWGTDTEKGPPRCHE